ncbi:type VI secretion system protein [Massilia genomosp. 1]|uniref:Type VI secretion system component TssM1 N-terminal domain-containing protein n=1 Tax=Massilia genomosp. 1 TaxID=2609280 RepID=A0ABX0N2N7_9BURK|nr:type VI secretion system protein [Massilia genomosp. 1]NHZ66142.1 hypothetical protein [Massilia genomosp. 1]
MSLPLWTWLALALLLVALILALITAAVLWRKTRRIKTPPPPPAPALGALQKDVFAAAMAALYPRDADLRYDKPCVLVCGPSEPGHGDLLRGAGLEPVVVGSGKECGWWRGSEGVAFALPAAAWEGQGSAWTDFLRLLERHRGRRALDAIVWQIPLDALENDRAGGEQMYRKLVDIQDRLGLRLPVYVVIGCCESVDGFGRWAARLPEAARAQALGWSNPNALGTPWRTAAGEQGVARLVNRLRLLVSAVSTRRDLGADAASIFVMPDQLGALLGRLPSALQEAMRENTVMTPFDLRGFYLSGRTRVRHNADAQADPFGPAAAPAQDSAPVFCRELFAQRIFGEFGLAQVVQRRLDAEKRSQLVVLGGACTLAAIWLICLVPSYFATQEQLSDIARPLGGIYTALRTQNDTLDKRDDIAMKELLTEMDKVQDWHTATYAMPASWHPYLGGLRFKVDWALKTYYEKVLFKNIRLALNGRAKELMQSSHVATREQGTLAANPEGVAEFGALRKFVDAAVVFEDQRSKFRDVTAVQNGRWRQVAELLDYLFDMKLNAASQATVQRFDRLLQASSYDASENDDAKDDSLLRAKLDEVHEDFLDGAFERNRLFDLQRELVAGVKQLNDDPAGEQLRLASLQRTIGDLRTLLGRTDAAWMVNGQLGNNEAYLKVEGKIRKSGILGVRADELHAKTLARQKEFHDEVVNQGNALRLLDFNEGKHLQVNADLGALEQAIGKLLAHRFAQGVSSAARPGPDTRGPLTWNTEQINAAQVLLADLQAYEAKELIEAPPSFQIALRKLARLQAGAMIDHHLALSVIETPGEMRLRALNFDDAQKWMTPLLAGMRQLEIKPAAQHWQSVMDTQAMALLTELKGAVDDRGLYLPDPGTVGNWDGTPAGAAAAFGLRGDDGAIREYLDAQLRVVAELASASNGARAWLAKKELMAGSQAQAMLSEWRRIDDELAKHAAKVPTGSLARLEKWFTEDLGKLDIVDCAERLPPIGHAQPDFFQHRMSKVAKLFGLRCYALEVPQARRSYGLIAAHFNRHLWNRYPFSAARAAAPADPAQVRRMLQLLDANMKTAGTLLKRRTDPASAAALAFIDRLAAVQPILAAMLTEDPAGGFAALDLWTQFRVNREHEKGGDQIIAWTIKINDSATTIDARTALSWRMADKIAMDLRWAKDSDLFPAGASTGNPTITWSYDTPWALLHLLREHAAPQSELPEREAQPPNVLRFKVATLDKKSDNVGKEANIYARLEVAVHGKTERLSVPAFPTDAAPVLVEPAARMAANENGETR